MLYQTQESKTVKENGASTIEENCLTRIAPTKMTDADFLAAFNEKIKLATNAGEGYRKALYEMFSKSYAVFHMYATQEKQSLKIKLENRLKDLCKNHKPEIPVTSGKTQVQHMILRLSFGAETTTTTVSSRARVFVEAINQRIEPEGMIEWLGNNKGIQGVLNKMKPETGSDLESREELIKRGESAAVKKSLGTVDSFTLTYSKKLEQPTKAVAIITCHPDGSFTVHAHVQNESALNSAYAAYAMAATQ